MNKFIYPPVGIILITYARTEYAVETIASNCEHLRYDGELGWWIADDGSSREHYETCIHAVRESGGQLFGAHQTNRDGYGRNANQAWTALYQEHGCEITLWLEDDWRLQRPLDISPYVRLLMERKDTIGMVRLGYMPVGLNLYTLGHNGHMYAKVMKDCLYAYSGNPHLKHTNFGRDYGYLPLGNNPGETEISYDHTFRHTKGVDVVWPLKIGDDPFYGHIGTVQSYG